MNLNNEETIQLGRRRAMQLVCIGLTAAGGLLALAGCNKGPDQPAAPAAKPAGGLCQFKVPVDEAARQMRRTLQYQERSTTAGKKCSTCSQFEAGKYGDCGGCKLFAGGVNAEGVCLSYAPLGGAPAAPAAPGAPAPAAPAAPADAPAKPG